jgi:hypothetical protein
MWVAGKGIVLMRVKDGWKISSSVYKRQAGWTWKRLGLCTTARRHGWKMGV